MNQTIGFNDIFKSSFLDTMQAFSLVDMVIALGMAFVIGLFIMLVYKKTYKGVMYSESFSLSILALTMVTTLIILAITSNVILSLGMVGALSIVRFRSAVKEPMDIAYLFWGISVGIVLGAGLIPLAVCGSLFIGLILVVFVNRKNTESPYILVVHCDHDQAEKWMLKAVKKDVENFVIKSKTVSNHTGIELTIEVRLKDMTTQFVNQIGSIEGVSNAVLVSYNGEYMQ